MLPTSIVLLIFMGTGSPFSLLSLKSTFFHHDVMSSPILKTVRVCESSGNVPNAPIPMQDQHTKVLLFCKRLMIVSTNHFPAGSYCCQHVWEDQRALFFSFLLILVPAFSSRISLLLSLHLRPFFPNFEYEVKRLSVDPLTSLCVFVFFSSLTGLLMRLS